MAERDINVRVAETWKEATTTRERVKEVIAETTAPTKALDIAQSALVSEPTTRKYLNELVEDGLASATQDGRTTLYKRNESRRISDRIEELRTQHSHEELIDGIREMKEQLSEFRETYSVEGPEELAMELEADEPGWADVGRWRATRQNLALAKAALQVDEAHRLAEA